MRTEATQLSVLLFTISLEVIESILGSPVDWLVVHSIHPGFGRDPVENEGKMSRVHLDLQVSRAGSLFSSVGGKIAFLRCRCELSKVPVGGEIQRQIRREG